jgi:basic membrane protein A and related proteins
MALAIIPMPANSLLMAGRFDVFWGPIKDRSGKTRIAAGEKPPEAVLLNMDWFIEGVVGTVPK